ncbi:MAG: methyltransferase domain-containing protein [Candidatus Krumholzibacteriia bacterium]
MPGFDDKKEMVREYYGKILGGSRDLKTNACCSADAFPAYQKAILKEIDGEILEKFYGCGSPLPPALEESVVLDLGCGTGRDAYMASFLVGPRGRVVGVDMTDEQLDVARRHVEGQTARFGYAEPNVVFKKGYIEDLAEIGIEDASVDVVISNCVINLSPDKRGVFREIARVLKPGGELYFSDVFSGRRLPRLLAEDPVLYGECLGGAMYREDFRRLMREVGLLDHRVVSVSPITIEDPDIEARAGMIDFCSMTIRAFKLDNLEDICEDYGQVATYRGTIAGFEHAFVLDDHHKFVTGKPALVCGNTAAMVGETRYGQHFDITGDRSIHYGPFDCTPDARKPGPNDPAAGACC